MRQGQRPRPFLNSLNPRDWFILIIAPFCLGCTLRYATGGSFFIVMLTLSVGDFALDLKRWGKERHTSWLLGVGLAVSWLLVLARPVSIKLGRREWWTEWWVPLWIHWLGAGLLAVATVLLLRERATGAPSQKSASGA